MLTEVLRQGAQRMLAEAIENEVAEYIAAHTGQRDANTRRKRRVVKVELRVVFGREGAVRCAPGASPVSTRINTAFIERHNGTDRNRNGRKVRKTYCFSKGWDVHEAVTYFTMYSHNFCRPVRTLRVRGGDGRRESWIFARVSG